MKRIVALVAGLVSAACLAQTASLPSYPCHRTAQPPQIDGQVAGDPAWQTVPGASGFRALGGSFATAKQTTVQACWDNDAIYIAFTCEEPDAKELKPTVKDGGPVWTEDGVEVFLQPKGDGQVYQLGVTSGGARGAGEGQPDIAPCSAAAKIAETSYSLEVRIPFKVLGCGAPRPGETWRGTFCRNIYATTSGGDKYSNWSPLQNRFLEPQNFGTLSFVEKALPAAEVAVATEELNREYRLTLLGKVRDAYAAGKGYTPALEEAVKHDEFRKQALGLLAEWQKIEQLNRDAERAPVLDLRRSLSGLEKLVQQSYETKYSYLIDKLLAER
ncbi:MAG: hypothetical protein A3K19_03525 [Lentisphaerae bacterium RIFOXYB12_FULL_65_16]|nr:MAG: hypothetical protein A3K18_30185 [Lentisphaerae bacterium RIFOXYA12_64_32]OGV86584.1 MAG: hypothetical protein A3K19_03525 [Lentisphaerae bacterium RIFOXYB12_FULL_65_16]